MQAEEYRIERYRRMTYGEKWAEMNKLRAFAIRIKTAGLRLQHPDWTEKRISEEVRGIFSHANT